MKKIFICVIMIFLFLTGCEQPEIHKNLRLAPDYNGDWGKVATNITYNNKPSRILTIAMLDSGINFSNERVLNGFNVIDENNDTKDKLNHGTILAKKLLDLNKNINIVPIKIFDNSDELNFEYLNKGIEKAIERKVDIINISSGKKGFNVDTKKLIDKAAQNNIIIVAAAGNNGEESLLFPASDENVISVMARNINNKDLLYNNRSENKKSFSAPGEHIICGSDYYDGTSIATVFVVGLISAWMETDKTITSSMITELLIQNSIEGNAYSYGFVKNFS